MTRRRKSSSQGGFVLAEALLCVVLIALTMALVGTTLTFGRRVADAGRGRDRIAQMSTGVQALADWLSRALAVQQIGAGGGRRVLFEGQARRLSFMTLSQGDTQPGGILAVTVALTAEQPGGTGALVFMAAPVPVGTQAPPAALGEQVLISHVVTGRFRYYGAPDDREPPRWLDHWTQASRLPDLVGLNATLALGPRHETIELTFPVFAR
ncbi:hypothetical protein AAII07_30310 [Microvirga sp. 0TCS3.31]